MRVRRWVAAAVCLPLLALSACSDDDPKADPEPTDSVSTPTPTESETPDEPVEPEEPAAMANEDEAGAEAFVEYYWEVVNYAQQTGDVHLLKTLAFRSCSACDGGVEWIEGIHDSGGKIFGGAYSMNVLRTQPLADTTGTRSYRVSIELASTKQRVLNNEGKVVERHPSSTSEMALVVALDGQGNWRVGLWDEEA